MNAMHPAASIAAFVCLTATAALAQSTALVSPADRVTLEGSSSTTYPLGRFDCRLQQIHADLGPAARSIAGHAYRRDAQALRDSVDPFATELEVVAVVSATAPDQAATTFAANLGGSPVTVLSRTTVSFPSTSRPVADPAPVFELRIPWSTPFQLPAGAPLCLDVTVHGNQTIGGPDRNFTPYLDAHELFRDGRNVQPGYRFGDGCAALATTRSHSARLEMTIFADGSMTLGIDSRDGVASSAAAPASAVLLLGLGFSPIDLPFKPGCRILPSVDALLVLPGPNDANGDWSGSLPVASAVSPGMRFFAQVASGIAGVDLTLSDGSVLTVPPLAPTVLPAVRIASGSDRSAPSGALSTTVPVTEFF
jgi:hypothetical protein